MFGASAGLNKPLLHHDATRRPLPDLRRHSVEKVVIPATRPPYFIKNPILRRLHGRVKCFLVEWIINRFAEKGSYIEMHTPVTFILDNILLCLGETLLYLDG